MSNDDYDLDDLIRRINILESKASQFESTILATISERDRAFEALRKIKVICDKIMKEKHDHFSKDWYPEMQSDGAKYELVTWKIGPIVKEIENVLGVKK